MDQKSESASMQGRLAWIISIWYLFVLWSWSAPLYGRNEELFVVSLVIMLSGVFLAVLSFARFLYELRNSAVRQTPPDNDFIARVLIDLGALTLLSKFSATMNRLADGFDDDAVLLLVSGVIVLTLLYGVIRVVLGIASIRGYLAARWQAVAVVLLSLAVAGAWHDIVRAVHLALAGMGLKQWTETIPQDMALQTLWYDGYVFSLALFALFLVMLAASLRQFRMIYADASRLVATAAATGKNSRAPQKPKVAERAGTDAVSVKPTRVAVKRR
jgi:hypothetical protein